MAREKMVTVNTLRKMKKESEAITMVTAYDYPSAKLSEEAEVEMILVGDSLGMVVLGYDSTVPVTLSDMLHHTKAVTRGAKKALVVTDLPFLHAHLSKDEVLRAAGQLLQEGGARAVKMEGGSEILPSVRACVQAGIPVMGHLGLTPQSVHQLGGYRIQGREIETAKKLMEDAKQLEEAGAFSLVLECVPEELAKRITESIQIPVIGIGAGRYCDGQVLVYHDLLQYGSDVNPSFAKSYASVGEATRQGIQSYVEEVKAGIFPGEDHVFHMKDEILNELYGGQGEGSK
ncbi:3-methyl-2-oxobutanoate hydroxymethyltransferase [Marininema halotolerans]|uniref:3-methyl-2-oxobutanoate hydroxymethyltransferase n=1 Tax=Marininema halotolerans TaxID=1155944 RepID=A0A1I6U0M4_9BACL|nr:3-methyl-2-oxobutanoate hydroxymethyltransferase [Marininema halotolerans]SFS94944.1 3-methyl-2-oxobutanoate hydroxymethyltransferase [Marininema halotolerans]